MNLKTFFSYFLFSCLTQSLFAQIQQFNVFFNFDAGYNGNDSKKLLFTPGGPNLFVSADVLSRLSFLGDASFNYNSDNASLFSLNLQRAVIKYNYYGNHSLLVGKLATPLNYWNDNYHFGRVFYPTISRPGFLRDDIIPNSTTGVSLQAADLGRLKFGYDLLIGNGIGSSDANDNDKVKSLTAALHIKPADKKQMRASVYHDILSSGTHPHTDIDTTDIDIKQTLYSFSVSDFENKLEILAESSFGIDHTDSLGDAYFRAFYAYAGYRIKKIVPYVRFDQLIYEDNSLYFSKNNLKRTVVGLRFEINYLAVLKLEYQYQETTGMEHTTYITSVTTQIAIGF